MPHARHARELLKRVGLLWDAGTRGRIAGGGTLGFPSKRYVRWNKAAVTGNIKHSNVKRITLPALQWLNPNNRRIEPGCASSAAGSTMKHRVDPKKTFHLAHAGKTFQSTGLAPSVARARKISRWSRSDPRANFLESLRRDYDRDNTASWNKKTGRGSSLFGRRC
jgi:hypothetical protein